MPAAPTRVTTLSRPLAALLAVAGLLVGAAAPLAAQGVDGAVPALPDTTTTTSPSAPTSPPDPVTPPAPATPPDPVAPVTPAAPSTDTPPPPVVPDGGIRTGPVDPNAPPPVLRDPTPRIRVLMARLDVLDRRARARQARQALVPFEADAATADALVVEAEGDVARATDAVAAAEGLMSSAAVNSFMYATGGASASSAGFGEYEQRRGEELSESVLDHRQGVVDAAQLRLVEAENQLLALRRVAEAAEQRVAAFTVVVRAVEDDLAATERALADAERGSAPKMFDRAAQDEGWQLEIMGPSTFTPDELVAWYAEKGQGGQTTEPVLDVVRYYAEEGQSEGVRGDVALAQAVLETGWFRNDDTRRFNNYAGIGHCDSCPTGFQFPSARIGVRAQLQHLKTYVTRDPVFTNELVDRRLFGPAGCCQTWNELTGVWATSPIYGPTLLAIYEAMLDWLVARRTLLAG